MSLNSRSAAPFATALIETLGTSYSYSRKRRDGFSIWQEHLRKLAGSVDGTPATNRDRDLRRAVVPG